MTDGLGMRSIHHVGIVVEDVDAAVAQHLDTLGGTVLHRATMEDRGVDAAAIQTGDSEVEYIAPLTADSAIGRFLASRGSGVHHIAWAVPDLAASLEAASAAGIRVIDPEPRIGLHGTPVAFLHPAGMNGVLTELVQE